MQLATQCSRPTEPRNGDATHDVHVTRGSGWLPALSSSLVQCGREPILQILPATKYQLLV
jgi:hypothetical protein